MLKLVKIGRTKIDDNIKEFVFDGCHKIYLISNEQEKEDLIKNRNYVKEDFYNIDKLEDTYYNSCSLRFINYYTSKDFQTIVGQFAKKVTFVYEDTETKDIEKHIIDFTTDKIYYK